MPNVRTGRKGELQAHIFVRTPTNLSERQEELLRELASLRGGEAVGDDKDSTPFDKVKDYIKKNLR
jgi:molecular chaperone DnaJ